MSGSQQPPGGGAAGGPGRPGRIPVGYQAAGGRPGAGARPDALPGPAGSAGPAGPRAGGGLLGGEPEYQAYEPYPTERPARAPGGSGGGGGFIDYPRHGRSGWRRWVPSWKQNLSLFGLGILMLIMLVSVVYATTDIPATDQKTLAQTTIFYYNDGQTEIGRLATQNRQKVKFNQVPLQVREAILAAEDRTFNDNSGVDPTSIVRAAWSNARGNATQGGSTITQQYVKNVYSMQKNRNVTTKVREFFIALKITKSMQKNDILEQYMNTIYFGRGAYGIQAASQAYFRKDVGNLNVSQAAYLAGIINAPSLADDPDAKHPDELARATRRWNVVMDAMVTQSWLKPGERAAAKFPKVAKAPDGSSLGGQKGYLVKMAQEEAAQKLSSQLGKPVSADDVETGGYKIVTTFNKRMMAEGVSAVKNVLPNSSTPSRVRVGMAAINPDNGAVWAIYGGKDYYKYSYNQATQAQAEGGSTFKAFGLLAALENDVSLQSRFRGTSPMTINGKKVQNFGNENFSNINLLEATKHSVNTVFVQLNDEVGRAEALKVARRAGLPASANMQDNLVNVLGSANPHAIDMASVYGTFAAKGTHHDPYTVKSISRIEGDTPLYSDKDDASIDDVKPAFDKDVMADLTYALQQPVEGGTGAYAQNLGRPAAGKTGTSNDSRSAWFVGYTPQISVAVMMYEVSKDGKRNVEIQPFGGVSTVTGGSFPVRIWTEFTKAALGNQPVEQFPPAANIGERIGIPAPAPVPTRTQAPTDPSATPSATPSADPSADPSAQPSLVLPTFGLPGQDTGDTTGQGTGPNG